jgi:hypothetical protein
MVRVEWGATTTTTLSSPGSFVLTSNGSTTLLSVQKGDEAGVLNGVGRLLRELRVERSTGTARLPLYFTYQHDATKALWPLRGHQISTAHHTSSFQTWRALHQYVTDLAVFGTNQIELAHTSGLEAALVNFSRTVRCSRIWR